MATLFYDHLVNWQKLTDVLDLLELEGQDRLEVLEHAEQILHTELFLVFVTHLPADKHDEFIQQFHAAPYDVTNLIFLKLHGRPNADIEVVIQERSNQIIEEILKELL